MSILTPTGTKCAMHVRNRELPIRFFVESQSRLTPFCFISPGHEVIREIGIGIFIVTQSSPDHIRIHDFQLTHL